MARTPSDAPRGTPALPDTELLESTGIRLVVRPTNSTDPQKPLHSATSQPTLGGLAGASAGGHRVGDETERARLIDELSRVMRDPTMPETTRTAGLTLIGWLARRFPGECAHAIGIPEARESERRMKMARQKVR